jgi:LmbE family N-acetylglucosaminyl deacetylase
VLVIYCEEVRRQDSFGVCSVSRAFVLLLAHPDDETFFAAGTIAKCVAEGMRVGLLCATRGERGATGDLCTIEELPRVREAELREVARILGIQDLEFLPIEDQQLARAPMDQVRRAVVGLVRRLRPEIVFTFDPDGANQHTDHMAISRFAMDGIAAAADPRWYPEEGAAHTVDRVLWPATVRVWELGQLADPANQPGLDYLIDIRRYREVKEAVLRAHRTQWPGLSRLFLAHPTAMEWECFRNAYGPRPAKVPAASIFP